MLRHAPQGRAADCWAWRSSYEELAAAAHQSRQTVFSGWVASSPGEHIPSPPRAWVLRCRRKRPTRGAKQSPVAGLADRRRERTCSRCPSTIRLGVPVEEGFDAIVPSPRKRFVGPTDRQPGAASRPVSAHTAVPDFFRGIMAGRPRSGGFTNTCVSTQFLGYALGRSLQLSTSPHSKNADESQETTIAFKRFS